MGRIRVLLCVLCVLAPLGAWAGYERTNEPNASDPMAVEIYELENGLRVYLTENHEKPRFYAEIAVRAGSKHDPADATGLAHYLEHLLFKGTRRMGTLDYEKESAHLEKITALFERHFEETDSEKRKEIYAEINAESQKAAEYAIANEIDKLYKAMGGAAVNAHTYHEETVYKVDLPSNRLRHWAAMESERFANPVFRIFHTELETVYEEKNRALDNKSRIVMKAVDDLLFKNHPYGQQPTLGSVEHLKKPSLVKIQRFYDTHYIPNNMAIFISGDIDSAEAIRVIDEHFSSWERKELPAAKSWDEEPLDGAERVTVKYQGEEYVLLAFRTAPRGHADEEALKLLDMTLDNSVAGLINLNLNQAQTVRHAGSYPQHHNDYGTQYLYGVPKAGQTLAEVEQLLLDQIEIVKKGEFEDWILPAIITDFKKTHKAQLESNSSRVDLMREAFLSFEEWDAAVAEIERMETVTKEDVAAAANRYFSGGYVAGYRVDEQHEVPKIEKPRIDKIEIDPTRQSKFSAEILAMPVEEIEPRFVDPDSDYTILDDGAGVKLYHAPNPLNDLFTLSISIEIGSREDNRLAAAARLLDKSGAGKHSAEDLQKEWYKLGASFSVGVGETETSISVSGLDENFAASVRLMMLAVNKPTADQETLDELVSIILQERADAKKQAPSIMNALIQYHRYGEDSRYLRLLPDADVKKLKARALLNKIKGLLDYKHEIVYTGPRGPRGVRGMLNRLHPIEGELKDTPPYRYLRARTPEKSEIYFFNKETAQAQARLEFADGLYDEADNPAIQLYNSYFAGGMSGIVFQELREARALAYSAGALYFTPSRTKDENLMVGAIGCQNDKTVEAVEAFIDLFDNLPSSPERFQESVDALTNRYRTSKLGFREVLGAVRAWEDLELEVDPRRERYEAIVEADLDLMLDFHETHIRGLPKMISIVGDATKIDLEKLSEFGEIVEVELDRIFVD